MKNRFKFKFCSSLECTLLRWLKMQGCLSQSWSNTVTLPLSSRCLRLCMFWSNLDGSLRHGGACPVWVSRFVSPRWASTSFLHKQWFTSCSTAPRNCDQIRNVHMLLSFISKSRPSVWQFDRRNASVSTMRAQNECENAPGRSGAWVWNRARRRINYG